MSSDFLIVQAYKPEKPVSQMNEAEKAVHDGKVQAAREEGQAWRRKHPVRIKHIVDHWNQATDDEKSSGENWYEDAHHATKAIAKDTGHEMHTAAGMMSNYSPQTPWHTNLVNAARVLRTRIPQGGPGEGIVATSRQKNVAKRLLDGEHYDTALSGPKTHAFAHLIEHGDNADEKDPKVVIDRHALSVASGARASDNAYSQSGLGGKRRYAEVSMAYHKAAKQISKQEGRPIKAHQVQAATWLVRQRLNEKHDSALMKTATSSRSAKQARSAMEEFNSYMGEHHPSVVGTSPGTGYSRQDAPADAPEDAQHAGDMADEGKPITHTGSRVVLAYGETVAPADVDTLQDESCPVCGETDLYSGSQCQVCGYDAPPKQFRDPDLTKARQMDLRKDQVDFIGDPNNPMSQDGNVAQFDDDGNPIPGAAGGDPAMDPNADPNADPEGGLLDPDQIDEDGNQVEQQTDDMGQVQPDAQSGESGLLDPSGLPDEGDEFGDQQPQPNSNGAPGTPEDGAPDLVCPACGFQADASQPMSTDTQDKYAPAPQDGTQAGDVCPNCQQALLMSPNQQQQAQQQMPAPVTQ